MDVLGRLQGEVEEAIVKWQSFLGGVTDSAYDLLKALDPVPATIAVKVPDLSGLINALANVFELGDQVHAGPVNSVRTIATVRKPTPIAGSTVRNIKILERRPGRDDPLGVEHLDLTIGQAWDLGAIAEKLRTQGVEWCAVESNEAHAWISIRHDDFEFKLCDHDVWQVCVAEMQAALT